MLGRPRRRAGERTDLLCQHGGSGTRVRGLLAHEAGGFGEHGFSGGLSFDLAPGPARPLADGDAERGRSRIGRHGHTGWRPELARHEWMAIEAGIDATRREAVYDESGPEHGVGLRLNARW